MPFLLAPLSSLFCPLCSSVSLPERKEGDAGHEPGSAVAVLGGDWHRCLAQEHEGRLGHGTRLVQRRLLEERLLGLLPLGLRLIVWLIGWLIDSCIEKQSDRWIDWIFIDSRLKISEYFVSERVSEYVSSSLAASSSSGVLMVACIHADHEKKTTIEEETKQSQQQ